MYNIPNYTKESLDRYAESGIPVGGFLYAVLTNNLFDATAKADRYNLPALKDICLYIYNELPAGCWGGPIIVKEWMESKKGKI